MDRGERDDPLAELERDERERLLFLTSGARWPVILLGVACWLALAALAVRGIASFAGADTRRGVFRWMKLALLMPIASLPVLVFALGLSATRRRNRIACWSIAGALLVAMLLAAPRFVRMLLD